MAHVSVCVPVCVAVCGWTRCTPSPLSACCLFHGHCFQQPTLCEHAALPHMHSPLSACCLFHRHCFQQPTLWARCTPSHALTLTCLLPLSRALLSAANTVNTLHALTCTHPYLPVAYITGIAFISRCSVNTLHSLKCTHLYLHAALLQQERMPLHRQKGWTLRWCTTSPWSSLSRKLCVWLRFEVCMAELCVWLRIKVSMAEFCVAELRMVALRVAALWMLEICVVELPMAKLRVAELCVSELCTIEWWVAELCVVELRTSDLWVPEICVPELLRLSYVWLIVCGWIACGWVVCYMWLICVWMGCVWGWEWGRCRRRDYIVHVCPCLCVRLCEIVYTPL